MDGLLQVVVAVILLAMAVCYFIAVIKGAMLVFEASTLLGVICFCLSVFTGIGTLVFVIPAVLYWTTGTNIARSIARDLGI